MKDLSRAKHFARKLSDVSVELEDLPDELDECGAYETADAFRTIIDGFDAAIRDVYKAIEKEEKQT